jgi:hypothetical protein
LLSACTGEKG